jgi:hypothetical protein
MINLESRCTLCDAEIRAGDRADYVCGLCMETLDRSVLVVSRRELSELIKLLEGDTTLRRVQIIFTALYNANKRMLVRFQ